MHLGYSQCAPQATQPAKHHLQEVSYNGAIPVTIPRYQNYMQVHMNEGSNRVSLSEYALQSALANHHSTVVGKGRLEDSYRVSLSEDTSQSAV